MGKTVDGETPFTLIPDDHPDTPIKGTIVAKSSNSIVVVTLQAIPVNGGTKDRTTYFCGFDEGTLT